MPNTPTSRSRALSRTQANAGRRSKGSSTQTSAAAQRALRRFANAPKGKFLQRFFKTAPGQYGHGDVFIGVTVPEIRTVARQFLEIPRAELTILLRSKIHEDRLLALIILTTQFKSASPAGRRSIYKFYLRHRKHVNNWDLVDASAAYIVGAYLHENPDERNVLDTLIVSPQLWDRRIAIVATHYFIRNGDVGHTLRLTLQILEDTEDLMHKASGWMLREAGKRDLAALKRFLDRYRRRMPRTMLRYAIERFPEVERRRYLAKD